MINLISHVIEHHYRFPQRKHSLPIQQISFKVYLLVQIVSIQHYLTLQHYYCHHRLKLLLLYYHRQIMHYSITIKLLHQNSMFQLRARSSVIRSYLQQQSEMLTNPIVQKSVRNSMLNYPIIPEQLLLHRQYKLLS